MANDPTKNRARSKRPSESSGGASSTSSSSLVPKLRFPEFRDEAAWASDPMSKLYSFERNNALSRDKLNYETGTVKNIHYGDIHTKFPALFDITKERVPFINDSEDVPEDGSPDYCVEGDLIFADASEDTNDVGKSMEIVSLNGERLLSGQHTILARRKDDTLIVGFGGHLFRSRPIRSQIEKEAQGTKVYAISATRLGNVGVVYPADKEEQRKIAACLTSLDALIAARGRKLAALAAHKKGLMQQLFPRPGEPLPRLRFPEFRKEGEWRSVALEQVIQIASGQIDPTEPPYCELPQIGSENIESGTGRLQNVKSAIEKGVMSGNYLFDEDDLLYSKIRPALNKVAAPEFKGICSADIYPLRPASDELLKDFLFRVLLSDAFLTYAVKNSARGKIPKINREALLAYETLLPSPAEQQRIAACLGSLDAALAAEAQALSALRTHKKGLMQQLFPWPVTAVASSPGSGW